MIFETQVTDAGADDGDCVWFRQEDCLQVAEREKKVVYVFDHFQGEAFRHLAQLGSR